MKKFMKSALMLGMCAALFASCKKDDGVSTPDSTLFGKITYIDDSESSSYSYNYNYGEDDEKYTVVDFDGDDYFETIQITRFESDETEFLARLEILNWDIEYPLEDSDISILFEGNDNVESFDFSYTNEDDDHYLEIDSYSFNPNTGKFSLKISIPEFTEYEGFDNDGSVTPATFSMTFSGTLDLTGSIQ